MSETDETGEGERITSIKEQSERLDRVESDVHWIRDFLGRTKDNTHAVAAESRQKELDAPTSMAEEIRQGLAELEERKRKEADAKGKEDRLAAVETSVREMAEKAPEPPARRVEKIMGWR